MLNEVSYTAGITMSAVSLASCAAGLFVGRKFGLAAGCKIAGAVAELFGNEKAAEWNRAGDKYWALAKKDAFRDLTAVAGFAALGLASGAAGKALLKEEEKKEEPGFLVKIASEGARVLSEYKRPIFVAIGLATAWRFRRPLVKAGAPIIEKGVELGFKAPHTGLDFAEKVVRYESGFLNFFFWQIPRIHWLDNTFGIRPFLDLNINSAGEAISLTIHGAAQLYEKNWVKYLG
jgi:hypothetical protein